MKKILASKPIQLSAVLVLLSSLLSIAYATDRSEFIWLTIQYSFGFISFGVLYFNEFFTWKKLLGLGVIIRLILFFAEPNLSNDYYRFLWDGRMILEGLNPYLSTPENWVKTNPDIINHAPELYKGMGSLNGSHFTCYPPINQFYFIISSIFYDNTIYGSMLWMRLFIFLSELGLVWFGLQVLKQIKLSSRNILLVFLNPYFILESFVSLHYEGVMIFFLFGALYYLGRKKMILGALFFAFSVATKAIPLLFLPLFLKYFGWKKMVQFSAFTFIFLAALFAPFVSQELYHNFMNSIELYFTNFEFNASIYYIVRYIGFEIKGYNIIHSVGKITPILLLLFMTIYSLFRKGNSQQALIKSMFLAILVYYLTATTVHPWYLILPLGLSVFLPKNQLMTLWSLVIILSYSAYATPTFKENGWMIAIEYLVVYSYLIYWVFNYKKILYSPSLH